MNRDLIGSLAWGGGIVVLALAASFARGEGYIDHETTTRIVICATGLMIAWFGNRMPKQFSPRAAARRVTRVGGWSMALSGLTYAGLWAFAPIDVAIMVGCGVIAAGMAVTIGYCLSQRAKAA